MPYGESLMELSNREYDNPYKYNGKEMDSQTGLYYYGARYYDPQRSFWLSVDPLVEITMSPYAYTWNDPVNYTDPSGMIGERIGDPGGPSIHKIYGPKGGFLIEEVVIKGIKRPNIAHRFMQMSMDLDKGFHDGITDYTKDAYHFVTENAYSKKYWQRKGGEALMTAAFISDMNKIRPDGSSNGMDVFNSIYNASAYDVGHFTGYNGAQFATTSILTEGGGLLLNSIKLPRIARFAISEIEFCFVKGTLIATEKGNKKIEDIKAGDLVWSYNEQTKRIELKQVTALSVNESKEIITINVGNIKIECTLEHPFYVSGSWVEAKYLEIGDELLNREGLPLKITSINRQKKNEKVYNFEVAENHNYYVSELGFLVHNNCGLELVGDAIKKYKKLNPTIKSNVDDAFQILKEGKAGGNQHPLVGDLKGFSAIDVKGSGRGRGGLRVIYKKEGNTIQIHDITDYHK